MEGKQSHTASATAKVSACDKDVFFWIPYWCQADSFQFWPCSSKWRVNGVYSSTFYLVQREKCVCWTRTDPVYLDIWRLGAKSEQWLLIGPWPSLHPGLVWWEEPLSLGLACLKMSRVSARLPDSINRWCVCVNPPYGSKKPWCRALEKRR